MSKEFSGKVVLITGASSGIGAGTAIHFAGLGANLALTGRNLENLQKVCEKCTKAGNVKPLIIKADVTKNEDLEKIIDSTIKHFGKLDVLVNNAGIFELGGLEEASLEQLNKIWDTNIRGVFQLTKLATPHLLKTKGNIVNVSSIAGLRAFPMCLSYSMTKSALDQFTQGIALELAPKKVRVNSVNPGLIVTDIFRRAGLKDEEIAALIENESKIHPIGRVGQVEDVANAIAFLASEKSGFITGVLLSVDGGRHCAVESNALRSQ